MTIALKIGTEDSQVQGFVYLDAVTTYTKELSGKVTSFPVDSGVNIADHFISENQKFTIEGVISDVDITGISDSARIGDDKPLNAKPRPTNTFIAGQENALQYLPASVLQFFEKTSPAVVVDASSQTNIPAVEMLFEELMRGSYYNQANNRWYNKMTPTVIYEMQGGNFVNARTDVVITDVQFNEDAGSGDALHISISAERVRFVNIDQTDMPAQAKTTSQKKVSGTQKKGTPNCPTGKGETGAPGTAAGGATNNNPPTIANATQQGYNLTSPSNPNSPSFNAPNKTSTPSFQSRINGTP